MEAGGPLGTAGDRWGPWGTMGDHGGPWGIMGDPGDPGDRRGPPASACGAAVCEVGSGDVGSAMKYENQQAIK